jgi:misacylated tRNA(Ala) deacylase
MGAVDAHPPLHSAEHLLTTALAQRLPKMGNHASRLKSRKCVFEFDHAGQVTADDIDWVQARIDGWIAAGAATTIDYVPRADASDLPNLDQVPDAADPVRVVHLGPFDARACVGTHVANTAEIRNFRITSWRPVGQGRWRVNFVVD